mmetsp:Transcript_886/g.1430  ORF Transcript_886/g.1430 Transcript_886/m.1430 type:complete len:1246 (-) Transcript_886:71-3808(-)
MEEFHTPESSAYPDQMRTPGTVSTAQRSSLPTSAGGTSMTASGKKRPASSSDHDDDDSDDSMDNNTSFFGRIVSSVTPWRRRKKRARSSLDSMSGSAIKSATRLPASEDSDRSNYSNGGAGAGAGDGSAKKTTLGKLNLEHKFHEAPAAAPVAATAAAAMPVQTLNGQQVANIDNEGNAAVKRVRVAEGTVPTATTNGISNGGEGAIKAVRIGGTTFVSSNTTTTTAKNTNSQSVSFQDATMPKFNIGSSATKLKDVRGRNSTPARGGRSKWGTPSAGAARYGTKHTLPQDGITTTTNKVGYQRRSIGNLSTPSRGGAYRRRAINARKYKPMGNILSRIHSDTTTTIGRNGAAAGQSKESLFLSSSIADQILRDTQNKLFQSKASSDGGNYQEVALFGVAPNNISNNGARTFEEEAAQYKAINNNGRAVPRVRMNRIFGSGQLGGRTQLESALTTATTTAKSFGTGGVTTVAAAASGTTASISLQHSIAGKSIMPATPSTSTRIATVPEPKAKDVTFSGETTFVPFKADPIPARGEGETQFTPCKVDENLSQQLGKQIRQLASTDAFKRKASQNYPFGDVSEATKTPKKKSKGTPHPKKAGGSSTKSVSEAAGGTPFNFMPGGAAASSKVDTPLAYTYGKKSDVPQSSSPAVFKPPKKAVVPVATETNTSETTTATSQGWGDLFASQKKLWKCHECFSQNPPDKTVCPACEAPRDGTASKSDVTSGGNKADIAKKASVGTGGFTFSAPASTAAPAPAAGSIGAGGFSFGGTSSSSASAVTPAIKFGVTPSKAAEQKEKNDAKTNTSSGFSFTGATPAKAKPFSGGFSFGGTSSTPSSTTEDTVGASDDEKDDKPKGNAGFSFGAPASSSSTSSKKNAAFSFAQNSASSGADENNGDNANTGAFKFDATPSDPKPKRGRSGEEENENQGGGKKIASVGAGFSFGSNATENKATPTTSFAFGAASKNDDAAPALAPTYSFGSKTSEKKSDNATTSFAFGSTAASVEKTNTTTPAATSGFSFGQSSASSGATSTSAEEKESAFTSSQGTATATPAEKKDKPTPTPAPAFAFGAAATPAAAFQFGSQAPTAAAPPAAASLFGGSGFGMTQTAQPAAPAPAFGFGAAAQTPTPAPAFGFGGSAQPAAVPAANPGFAFGSNPTAATAPAPAFGMPPAAPPVATPAPAFGLPSAATPAPSGFGGGFGGTQAPAPAMNGGAASGGFNIGTGGGTKKTPGRRIVRAKRPQGSGR